MKFYKIDFTIENEYDDWIGKFAIINANSEDEARKIFENNIGRKCKVISKNTKINEIKVNNGIVYQNCFYN